MVYILRIGPRQKMCGTLIESSGMDTQKAGYAALTRPTELQITPTTAVACAMRTITGSPVRMAHATTAYGVAADFLRYVT